MGTGRSVVWTLQAQRALEDVLSYVAADSPEGARKILSKALDAGASLAKLSDRGRIVPELADASIRELLIFRYRLLYQVTEHEVQILAFLHGARDFHQWRKNQGGDAT